MSRAGLPDSSPALAARREADARRAGRRLKQAVLITAVVLVLLSPLLVFLAYHGATHRVRLFAGRYGLGSYGLLYLEESGVPLPVPGDVFVVYLGVHLAHRALVLIAAWLGVVGVVVLGSTNLYWISRAFGRRLVQGWAGAVLDLSPARLATAERWFRRWGPLAIIFGRHIPGFRVPITVASGLFQVSFRVFAACVAVSSAIWAGVLIILSLYFGRHVVHVLNQHPEVYFLGPAALLVGGAALILFRLRQWDRRARAEATPFPR